MLARVTAGLQTFMTSVCTVFLNDHLLRRPACVIWSQDVTCFQNSNPATVHSNAVSIISQNRGILLFHNETINPSFWMQPVDMRQFWCAERLKTAAWQHSHINLFMCSLAFHMLLRTGGLKTTNGLPDQTFAGSNDHTHLYTDGAGDKLKQSAADCREFSSLQRHIAIQPHCWPDVIAALRCSCHDLHLFNEPLMLAESTTSH